MAIKRQVMYKEELSDELYKKNIDHIVDHTDKDEPMHINLLTKEYSSPNKIIYFSNGDNLQEETLENKEMALANMLNPNTFPVASAIYGFRDPSVLVDAEGYFGRPPDRLALDVE
uniref:Uncharacterized protein n=1 Tax=Timema bartmani TaxID=61472 RepID=A0A7R9I551_9NEOP|nr:unnamed protein product [Timema bartmani]